MSLTDHNRDLGATYYSTSRKQTVPMHDEVAFNDFHLVAAHDKLRKELISFHGDAAALDTLLALAREMGYRDLAPGHKGGRPPGDPRLHVPEPPPREAEEVPQWDDEA